MKIFSSYSSGFILAAKTKKLSLLIYLLTLFLVLVIAIPFKDTIERDAGNSMAFVELLKDFDYTVYKDFTEEHWTSIKPYFSTAIWMGIFYLLFTIFFEGGILTILRRKEDKYLLKTFWEWSAFYFWRFFRLAVYIVIIQLVIIFIIYFLMANILDYASGKVESEASLILIGSAGVLIHVIIFIFILTAADYAKIMIAASEGSIKPFSALFRSFGFAVRHFISTYFLYLFILITLILFSILYFWIESAIGMSSSLNILIIFFIQQCFIWLRIFMKIWLLGSELSLYRKFKPAAEGIVKRIPVFEV